MALKITAIIFTLLGLALAIGGGQLVMLGVVFIISSAALPLC